MAQVRVPGSSANLGPGFDVLGLAVTLYLEVDTEGSGPPAPSDHPAVIAYRSAGGDGPLWARSGIPPERGLGFSGAARVAGLLAAGVAPPDVLTRAAALEGHADNVAPSLMGGLVAVAGGQAVRVPMAVTPAVVVWLPERTASTDAARAALPDRVPFADAVANAGRAALLVAALAAGDVAALREATRDRLHQEVRLARLPASRAALEAALAAGAWAAWLSGSGPAVAAFADPDRASAIASRLPEGGTGQVLAVDQNGARIGE